MKQKKSKKDDYVKQVLKTGIVTMLGVGMMGATAGMVNALPVGTARTIAGTTIGLQGVALLGPNLKLVDKSLSYKKKKQKG